MREAVLHLSGFYSKNFYACPGNVPGARLEMNSWTDASGNLWLFGGYGTAASGSQGDLSDLWMYMPK
jgi:hypothetical protein